MFWREGQANATPREIPAGKMVDFGGQHDGIEEIDLGAMDIDHDFLVDGTRQVRVDRIEKGFERGRGFVPGRWRGSGPDRNLIDRFGRHRDRLGRGTGHRFGCIKNLYPVAFALRSEMGERVEVRAVIQDRRGHQGHGAGRGAPRGKDGQCQGKSCRSIQSRSAFDSIRAHITFLVCCCRRVPRTHPATGPRCGARLYPRPEARSHPGPRGCPVLWQRLASPLHLNGAADRC